MRILIDSLIAVMLVAGVVVLLVLHNERKQDAQAVTQVQGALDRLSEQADYHTAVQSAMAGQDTLLVHVHEQWFGDDVPRNALLGDGHPWIDLAPPGDLGTHPPDPVVTERGQAGFWYNPTTGTFRARVTPRSTEAQTLALYNEVNGTALQAFEQLPDPTRRPIAHTPGSAPAHLYATQANRTWSAQAGASDPQQADEQPLYVTPEAGDVLQVDADVEVENPSSVADRPELRDLADAPDGVTPVAREPARESEPSTAAVRPTLE